VRPSKPAKDYPMYAHPSGQWARKINGRMYYFGVWADPDAARARHDRELPYLKEGKTPPPVETSEGLTLRALCNDFLRAKEDKLRSEELSPRTFRDYYRTCQHLLKHFGKDRRVDDLRPDDFRTLRSKMRERLGVVSLLNEINRIHILFRYAHENRLIPQPVCFGQHLDKPAARDVRKVRNEAGPKLFTRDEIRQLLGAVDAQLKAMILLGINCGFGNTDVALLPLTALDLDTGWVNFPRPKTEIRRRIPLWAETVVALREAIAARPAPEDPSAKDKVFLTRWGRPWVRVKGKGKDADSHIKVPVDAIHQQLKRHLAKLGINGRRRLGFYTLRHCFETVGGEAKDQVAVDACMGHVDASMAAHYRQGISDERLLAVTEMVRTWLFGTKAPSRIATGEAPPNG
jgi:integrase